MPYPGTVDGNGFLDLASILFCVNILGTCSPPRMALAPIDPFVCAKGGTMETRHTEKKFSRLLDLDLHQEKITATLFFLQCSFEPKYVSSLLVCQRTTGGRNFTTFINTGSLSVNTLPHCHVHPNWTKL